MREARLFLTSSVRPSRGCASSARIARQVHQTVSEAEQAISANHVYSAFSPAGEAAKDYRICVVGIGGHYTEEIFLECPEDNAAKETASQWVDGHDVELWQHERLVAKFISKPK